jgi:hypothetical protein
MSHGSDVHSHPVRSIEEEAVIAAAQAKAGQRRLKSLNVPAAADEIMIDAVKNFERSLSINSTQISACFGRPNN